MVRRILIIVLTFSCALAQASQSSVSQYSQPAFYQPLTNTNLIEGEISATLEDQHGFIWFIAINGVWRWDSKALVKGQLLAPQTDSSDTVVYDGFTGQDGALWICTSDGLYRLIAGTTEFTPVMSAKPGNPSCKRGTITRQADEDVVIFASDSALYQYTVQAQQIHTISTPANLRIHAVHIDHNGTLWVGTSQGLFFSEASNHLFGPLKPSPEITPNTRISVITSTLQDELIIGSAADGLFSKQGAQPLKAIPIAQGKPPWLYSIVEIRPDVLLIGTFGDGLIELDLNTGKRRHFRHNRLLPAGIADNNIWSLYQDSRGLVWIGAGSSLNVYQASSAAVEHVFGDIGQANGLAHQKVTAVQRTGSTLAVGNGDEGVQLFNLHEGVTATLWPDSGDPVETLFSATTGQLYASANFATAAISIPERQVSPQSIEGRNPTAFTTAIADSTKALWLGGTDGLWQQVKADGPQTTQADSLLSQQPVASLLKQGDTLWIGGWQGLSKAQLVDGVVQPDSLSSVENAQLDQRFIADLYADNQGQLWVATSGAGVFVRLEDEQWLNINTQNGLPGDDVVAIAGQRDEHVWLSTSHGIVAIDIAQKHIKRVAVGADTVNSPYSREAATISAAGDIVFGGANGLTVITPELKVISEPSLATVLTRIEVVTARNKKIHLPYVQGEKDIAPLAKRISLEFIALDYLNPSHLSYRYRFQGDSENWTTLDSDHREVTITQPGPGTYQLEIEYSHDGITWSPGLLTQPLTVLPAWYQTNYAAAGGFCLLALAIYLLHLLGLRHYRYRQRLLEEKIATRTAELVTANQKLTEQAVALEKASLTDALTGLHNRRFLRQNIQRDISRKHRYYNDCERTNKKPDYTSDMLYFVIDLDHFKRINDTYGHNTGDKVLVETQQRLSAIFRDSDYLIRWGGEEFLAVVQNTSREDAPLLAERIVSVINAASYDINDSISLQVTCSVGFAAYPLHQRFFSAIDWQATVGIADAALYGAKRRNRNTWMGVMYINDSVSESTLEIIREQPNRVFDHARVLVGKQQ